MNNDDDDERAAITAAMARLFAGTPTRSSGNLDILALAQEAGLKRNKLTHRHTDLKHQFYVQRAARYLSSQMRHFEVKSSVVLRWVG